MIKVYNTISCCGIDCGLCPRYHTRGDSVCPGCDGPGFSDKHPSCGFISCCVVKRGLETCAECGDYPCKRFDAEKSGYDSFVTHQRVFANLNMIKSGGYDDFLSQQLMRMNILKDMLERFDDGRSKSFFCLSCALLPVDKLKEIQLMMDQSDDSLTSGERCGLIRKRIQSVADEMMIELKLNRKVS